MSLFLRHYYAYFASLAAGLGLALFLANPAQAYPFTAAASYPLGGAGYLPYGIVSADLNNDGWKDLATANYGSDDVTVFLNSGNGTFVRLNSFALAAQPLRIVSGDFNRDGNLDIATAHLGGGAVSVLFGAGDGTLGPATTYPVAASLTGLAATDVNGDAVLDLVAVSYSTRRLYVLIGAADGTFQLDSNSYAAGPGPQFLASGDLNNDTHSDAVVANYDGNTLSVFFGNGAGAFSAATTYAVPERPIGLVIADLDGNGAPDVAVTSETTNSVAVLLGAGDGTLQPGVAYAVGAQPYAVAAADVTGDGISDLATANFAGNSVSVLVGAGDGTFSDGEGAAGSGKNFQFGFVKPVGIAVDDWDSDGGVDIAVTNYGGAKISAMLNPVPPVAPGNLRASAVQTMSLTLAWETNAATETGFTVEQSPDGAQFTLLTTTGANATSFGVVNLQPNTRYFFRAAAINGNGSSGFASLNDVFTLATVPADLTLLNAGETTATLGWSGDASWYQVLNQTTGSSSDWTTSTSTTVSQLACGTAYVFAVKGKNGSGVETALSDLLNVTLAACPLPPAKAAPAGSGGGINYVVGPFTAETPTVPAVTDSRVLPPPAPLPADVPDISANIPTVPNLPAVPLSPQAVLGVRLPTAIYPADEAGGIEDLLGKVKPGERSPAVKALQTELKRRGFLPRIWHETDYYGWLTTRAVLAYRIQAGVPTNISGIKIRNVQDGSIEEILKLTRRGSRGSAVWELQRQLRDGGFFPSWHRLTGFFGPLTAQAVERYLAVAGD